MTAQYPLAKALIGKLPLTGQQKTKLYTLHEVISNIERRNATKAADRAQAVSGVATKDIIGIALILILYIAANSAAPTVWTPDGTVDPATAYHRF